MIYRSNQSFGTNAQSFVNFQMTFIASIKKQNLVTDVGVYVKVGDKETIMTVDELKGLYSP